MSLSKFLRTYKRPWVDRDLVYFAIVHTPRSGSNYLAELLDSADGITCHTEIFSPHSTYLSRQSDVAYIDRQTRDQDLFGFLQRLVRHASGASAFGFKIGMYDLRWMLVYVLSARRVKKVVVYRRNLLAAFVSLKEAERSGAWIQWSHEAERRDENAKLTLSLREFYIYAAKIKLFYAAVKVIEWATLQTFKWMSYEEMRTRSPGIDVGEFLGLDLSGNWSARTEKQNRGPLRDRIGNIDHVQYFMGIVRADWMLNENA